MNKIQQDVEQYIRHLQSSLDRRKKHIQTEQQSVAAHKKLATGFYLNNKSSEYKMFITVAMQINKTLQQLHKEQATETRMLKFFENARSFAKALEECK